MAHRYWTNTLLSLLGATALGLVAGCAPDWDALEAKIDERTRTVDAGGLDNDVGPFRREEAGGEDPYVPPVEDPIEPDPEVDAGSSDDVTPYVPPVGEDAGCNDCEDADGFTDAEQDWFDAGDAMGGEGEPDGNLAPIARACPYDLVPGLEGVEIGEDGVCTYRVPRGGIDIDFSGACEFGEHYCPESEDPDGSIERYELARGNGLRTVNDHGSMGIIFDEPGVYEAELTVTDDQGETSTDRARFLYEE